MIKLKHIVDEIVWRTPPGSDIPEVVADVVHRIMAVIMEKDGPEGNPHKYVRLFKTRFPQIYQSWVIQHKEDIQKALVYSLVNNQWYYFKIGWANKTPINDKILDSVIRDWIT